MNPTESLYKALHKEEIAKGEKCWHKFGKSSWSSSMAKKVKCLHCPGEAIGRSSEELESKRNPNYLTPSGFFELKGELEEKDLEGKFKAWCWWDFMTDGGTFEISPLTGVERYFTAKSYPYTVIKDPLTFALTVYDFMKDTGRIG